MRRNKSYSYNIGSLCDGCKECIKGRKIVVYITGICPRKCFYCPLSDQKKNKDVIYANERLCAKGKINANLENKALKEVIEESKISRATGAGITGGDPLARLFRTIKLIKMFKKELDDSFHIHLYTSLDLVDRKSLKKLYDAGLDEIRFHPDLYDEKLWNKIRIAKEVGDWKIGVEIPVIPGNYNKTWKLINQVSDNIDFLNLNELEISDTNGNKLLDMNFVCKNQYSYAIKGSHEMALRLLNRISINKIKNKQAIVLPVHYCTSKLKDGVQMANRLKLRAKSVKKPYEVINDEGMLIRGLIKFTKFKKAKMETVISDIIKGFNLPKKLIELDIVRKGISIAPWVLDEISMDLKEYFCSDGIECIIQTEYPTWDRMIVDRFKV